MEKNPIINLFGYTWKYSAGNRGTVVLFIVLSVMANIVGLLNPLIIGKVFNSAQFPANDPNLLSHITFYLMLLLATELGFWLLHGTSRTLERRNAFFARRNYKQEMLDKVMDLPTEWHKEHHSGDTIDKINKSSDSLYRFSGTIFRVTENSVKLIGSLALLAVFDVRASVIAVIASAVAIASMLEFDKRLKAHYYVIHKFDNHLAAAVHDYISNIITIITLKLKSRASKEIADRSLKGYEPFKTYARLNEIKWFWVSFLIKIMIVAVLILYAYRSYHMLGVIMIGTLFSLYQYLNGIGNTFYNFANLYGDFVEQNTALISAEVINEEYKKIKAPFQADLPEEWENLRINNISFTYDRPEDGGVVTRHVNNISLNINNGHRVAFIGESGSGKSTVLAILRGLYELEHVEVICDGKILPYGLHHIHECITLIPQDPELFNSTVEDNITMDTKVTPKLLDEVIDMAQFRSVLNRLKQGLQTNVMEKGVSLSGGEKQRLALARGLLAAQNSSFVFMDEPTSSVDSTNELKIYENVFKKFKGKTIISTIHRLHLLKFFDYIYFFKDGTIFAEGTFEQLLKNKEFKTLWQNYNKSAKY